MKPFRNILITRTDRLGDVLMSLHTVRFVRQALPDAHIDFLVHYDLIPVLQGLMESWRVVLKPAEALAALELGAYDAALCLHDEPRLLAQLKAAGVKVRIGNYSKLRSFLKLSHGIRQRRGLGQRNEAECDLELGRLFLGVAGADTAYVPVPIHLPISEGAAEEAGRALKRAGIERGESYWIAHPGMGGSALNLGPASYVKLLDEIAQQQTGPLVLTLGPAPQDLAIVENLADRRPNWRVLPRVSLAALGEVFRGARLVVAPSTGPLHLAHYVGADSLGIYSPVRSHQPRRWAPWGGAGKSTVLSPEIACPGKKNCLGKKCKHYYCMDQLSTAAPRLQRRLG